MSKKRRRELGTVDVQLVEIYEDLANESEDIRLRAAHALLLKVCDHTSTIDHVEVVRRLIRGLCSSRKAARIGFSVALTEYLSQLETLKKSNAPGDLSVSELVSLWIEQTHISGNVSGQEERDHQFGRLFGAEAFLKSGILFDRGSSFEGGSRLLDTIFESAKKKPWLREECGWIMVNALAGLSKTEKYVSFVQIIVDKFYEHGLAKTPEGLALWIQVQSTGLDVVFPLGVWHDQNPLHGKEKANVSKVLKEASAASDHGAHNPGLVKKGDWSSKVHFAWNIVLARLLDESQENNDKALELISFKDFWTEAVDQTLFAESSSSERKYWGFSLFQQIMRNAQVQHLDIIFSPNFMRCLINQLNSSERFLHRIAEKTSQAVLDRAKKQPFAALPALKGFLSASYGRLNFEPATKSKMVEKLIALADNASLQSLLPYLEEMVIHPGTEVEKTAAVKRRTTADLLVNIIRSRHLTEYTENAPDLSNLIQEVFNSLIRFAYLSHSHASPEAKPSPAISQSTLDDFRNRITSCLTHVLFKSASPSELAYNAVKSIPRQQKHHTSMQLLVEFDPDVSAIVQEAWMTLRKIYKISVIEPGQRPTLQAFIMVYSLTIFQVHNGDPDAVELLGELKTCNDTLMNNTGRNKNEGCSVLVEILLNFVSKPSLLFRRSAQLVFDACVEDFTRDDLISMSKVLEAKENSAGQNELFEQDDEEEDENSHIATGAMSDASDLQEFEDDGSESEAGQAGEASNTDSNADEDEKSDSADSELATFNAKLAQALRTRPGSADLEANSEDEDSDEDMDDEQMEALDEHIATMFKERKQHKNKKTQKKNAREIIVNFKCRVLELFEIFIKRRHSSLAAFDLVLPLLIVIRTTTSSLVSGKAYHVIREYSRLCKGKDLPQIGHTQGPIFDLLERVHEEELKMSSNAHAAACSQASLLLAKTLVAQDQNNVLRIYQVYTSTLRSMGVDPRCKIKVSFITDWLNWWTSVKDNSTKLAKAAEQMTSISK